MSLWPGSTSCWRVNHFAPDNNGGRLGFYPVDGVNNSVMKRVEYSGFAKIKDVVYRERR